MNNRILLLNLFLLLFLGINAQQSISDLSVTYSQNFNSLAKTGATSNTLPANWHINVSANPMVYKVDVGSSNSGGIYSYGVINDDDRALGSVASSNASAKNIMYGMQFENNTINNIQSITVSYTGELWRLGSKNIDTLFFQYNINADSIYKGTWVSVPQLNFTTPDTTGVNGSRVGNDAPYKKNISYTITGLNISPSATFWIKWRDFDGLSSDDGLAIDDLSVSFAGVTLAACTTPTNNVSNVLLNSTITEIATSFTKASNSQKHLVVYSKNSTLSNNPVDKTNYFVGESLGGGTVAYIGNELNPNFIINKLIANTNYTLFFFPFNDSCSGGPLYKVTSIISQTIKTKPFPNTSPYYVSLDTTLTCEQFKTALKDRISNGHTALQYNQIPEVFGKTDMANGYIIDRYSTCQFTLLTNLGCPASSECNCYNREHLVPYSWFGTGENYPMYSDMNFIYPSDAYVNSVQKENLPLGTTSTPYYTNGAGVKVGKSNINGYSGDVFEPGDQYKGDFARAFLYFVTRYEDSLSVFKTRYASSPFTDSLFTGLEPWLLKTLVNWSKIDPPSSLEISRNDSVYQLQGNRNPYIDHPEWVEKAFGPNGNGCEVIIECNQPDTVATKLLFTNVTENSISGSFNKATGADGYVVIYRKGKSFLTTLTNNQTYTVGQMITKTSGTITDTSYVGYVSANPNDTTFNITGLVDNARYWIAVIPYKNCPSGKNYRSQFIDNVNKNDTTTANSSTTCDDPGQAPEGLIFTSITKNSISGKFNKAVGGADAYLVLYRASSSFIVAPTDGQTYTVGQLITKVSGAYTDSSTIGYISSGPNDTTFTINGLDAGKLYWIAVIPFNNCPSGPSYRTVIITNVNKNDTSTSSPNAIKINKELNFSVYPNPVSNNRLNIQLDKSNIDAVRVQIVDITGRILFNGNIPEHTKVHQLEIANFGKGMYFLQLEDKNGLNTVPFLVQ